MLASPPPSASRLLRVEHAVAEALLAAPSAPRPRSRSLLAAVGEGLGWRYGGVWLPVGGGVLHCVATWTAGGPALERFALTSRTLALAPGEGLPGRVQATRAAGVDRGRRPPTRTSRAAATPPTPACTPRSRSRCRAPAARWSSSPPPVREPDEDLMATLASLGRLVGQFVEHRRAEAAVHESEARKRAMLDAALDAVITIDAGGRIVEVNAAVQDDLRPSRPTALVGRELGAALVPPHAARAPPRRARARPGTLLGKRVEITALHADGREFPVELTITRIDVPGPPMYTGYVRDITDRVERERELQGLARPDRRRRRRGPPPARARPPRRRAEPPARGRAGAQGAPDRARADAAEQLARVREELRLATDELRELARGIHPAVLTELGLIPALRTLVRRAPLPVGARLRHRARAAPPPVEAAAYFLAAEALTNVVRYANATRADIRVDTTDGTLTIEIADDGARRRRPGRRLRPARDGRPARRARRHARRSTARPAAARASRG